jgi:PAS domain S-box-containing protein
VRKHYSSPRLFKYRPEEVPQRLKSVAEDLPLELSVLQAGKHVAPDYTTLVNSERDYVRVSDSFCDLVGYAQEELVGKKYDYLAAPEMKDIPTLFKLFKKTGYAYGLWILVHRTGAQTLVRYEAWLRPDSCVEAHMELVRHLG